MRSSASHSFFSSEQSAALKPAGEQAAPCAPAGGEAAGLVSSKTSDPSFLDVGFSRKLVMERRVKRLRRQVWAAGHLQRFRTPNGMRENVWFVTLTYRGVHDWQPRHISKCLKAARAAGAICAGFLSGISGWLSCSSAAPCTTTWRYGSPSGFSCPCLTSKGGGPMG